MRAKDYLERIQKLDVKINTDIELLAQYEALATKRTAVIGGERVQTSASQGTVEKYAVEMVDLREKINAEIDVLIERKEDARKLIQSACDNDCISLLFKRYIGVLNKDTEEVEYLTWEKIAVEMGFTYQWVSGGLHKRALSQVQKKLDERGNKT
ncbi:MAG: hypothetical protein IKW21_05240 [Lachnospiraceae bacterium]|nr:hypothetical protein [Lachnospiraceae bacterium]